MNNQEQIEEILFQLEQDNFAFAEKLINIFQLNSFEKEDWGFLYQKDEIEIDFDFDGTKRWLKNGKVHRDGDKPAIIWSDGTKFWYKNGERHRDGDEPAVVCANGTKEWWVNGVFIREEGKNA